jgi:hypothetical protein
MLGGRMSEENPYFSEGEYYYTILLESSCMGHREEKAVLKKMMLSGINDGMCEFIVSAEGESPASGVRLGAGVYQTYKYTMHNAKQLFFKCPEYALLSAIEKTKYHIDFLEKRMSLYEKALIDWKNNASESR